MLFCFTVRQWNTQMPCVNVCNYAIPYGPKHHYLCTYPYR